MQCDTTQYMVKKKPKSPFQNIAAAVVRAREEATTSNSIMEAAHRRLSDACLLVSRAAGTLEAACNEYEAAQATVRRWSQTTTGDHSSGLDDVLDRAKGIRQMRLDDGDAPSTSGKRRTLPVDFVELKERYMSVVPANERVLLDIRERVSESSRGFMDKLAARRRRGGNARDGGGSNEREDCLSARSVLGALRWIQGTMKATDWTRLRAEEMSTGELCDAAYALGNVVRLWKECGPVLDSLMNSDDVKVLRRRDDFLTALAQSKHLRYANRSVYAEVDERALRRMEGAGGEPSFLTWLPRECWLDGSPPPRPPDPSLSCDRTQYVQVALMWQQIQMNLFMAHLENALYEEVMPELFDDVDDEDDDELAYKLRLARSIVLAGKSRRCATIGVYQDVE